MCQVHVFMKAKVSFIILPHCCRHWPCWLCTLGGVSSLTKTLISQSVLCTFAFAFTLALCVKCRRTLKGTLVYHHLPSKSTLLDCCCCCGWLGAAVKAPNWLFDGCCWGAAAEWLWFGGGIVAALAPGGGGNNPGIPPPPPELLGFELPLFLDWNDWNKLKNIVMKEMVTYYTNNECLWVQWYKYFHEVKDEMFHSTRRSRVEWTISSFTEWKYLFHCTNEKTFIICFI